MNETCVMNENQKWRNFFDEVKLIHDTLLALVDRAPETVVQLIQDDKDTSVTVSYLRDAWAIFVAASCRLKLERESGIAKQYKNISFVPVEMNEIESDFDAQFALLSAVFYYKCTKNEVAHELAWEGVQAFYDIRLKALRSKITAIFNQKVDPYCFNWNMFYEKFCVSLLSGILKYHDLVPLNARKASRSERKAVFNENDLGVKFTKTYEKSRKRTP
jgi:hypothetical protein